MDPMTHLILHRQREHEAIAAAEHRVLIRLARRLPRRDPRGTPAPPPPPPPTANAWAHTRAVPRTLGSPAFGRNSGGWRRRWTG